MATPLPAPAADPTAVFGRRVGAFVIDSLVVSVPGVAIASTGFKTFDASSAGLDGTDFCDEFLEQADGSCFAFGDTVYFSDGFSGASLAPLGLSILLLVVVQGLTGWTVGKLLLGLRTVKEDGSVVGVGKAFVRWLLLIVDSLPCLGLVGLITAGTSTGHRRVGDMAAKTYVVRADRAGGPVLVPGSPLSPSTAAEPHASSGSSAWTTAPSPGPAPTASGAQWDPARNAYIQWDADGARWLQWDDASQSWSPIPGQ